MKNGSLIRHKTILTALKRAGYKVVEVVEQDKKTVIAVSSYGTKCSTNKDRYAQTSEE
jgi:hypothetical protein